MPRMLVRRAGPALAAVVAAGLTCASARAEDEGSLRALTDAYNASGHDLFAKLAAAPGNIVFSPYSIGTAMAMTLSGARGDTEREMARVLRHTLPPGEIDAANAGVLAMLAGYDKSTLLACPDAMHFNGMTCEAPKPATGFCPNGLPVGERCIADQQGPASAKLKVASALMLPHGALVSADYAGLLNGMYRAEVLRDAALGAVNGWVNRQTDGKIAQILDRIDPRDAMILNAIYFQAAWRKPFAGPISREDFSVSPTEKVKVAMMHRKERYAVVRRPGYRAIRLPYTVDTLAMVIVLPDEVAGTTRLAGALGTRELAALLDALNVTKEVEVTLPRFQASFQADLKPLFRQAGMVGAFDPGRADFSGMTAQPRFAINDIKHRAVIDVTEWGTEGAAATVVSTRLSYVLAEAGEPFVVDRPFLFYVVDQASGAILFEGRVSDPR